MSETTNEAIIYLSARACDEWFDNPNASASRDVATVAFRAGFEIAAMDGLKASAAKDARIAAIEAQVRELKGKLTAAEQERDEALACLRRCGVAASDLLESPDGITQQAQHALDNPLQADQLVNDRIAELECQVAQAAGPDGLPIATILRHYKRAAHDIGDLFCWCVENLYLFPPAPGEKPWLEGLKDRLKSGHEADMRIAAILDNPTLLLKPLEWQRSAAGWYTEREDYEVCFSCAEYAWFSAGFCKGNCDSLEAAQAACWQDYCNRMLAAFREGK